MTFDSSTTGILCAAVAHRLDENDPDLAAHIRAELPSYANIPESEHRRTLREFTHMILDNVAQGRGPVAEHLQFARRAARRRAHLGVSAYDVLRSFHIGNRALWAALQHAPEATDEALIGLVEPLTLWTEAMTATVVDAFVDEGPTRQARESRVRQQFFAELGSHDRPEQLAEMARMLAFDVNGEFQALCSPRAQWPETEIESLQRSARRLPGVVACGVRGTVLVVLGQNTDIEAAVRTAQSISGADVPFGIGLLRPGLDGAHTSTTDAERALRAAQAWHEPTVRFADGWLEASLLDTQAQLAPLFDRVQQVRRTHPELATAVLVYADSGFSLARAAKTLRMHPNSVSYRLTRWHELTGADPRTFSGLVRSVIGSRIAPEVS